MPSTDPPYYRLNLDDLDEETRTKALHAYDALAYEIQMLRTTATLALKHWTDKPLRYVLIESYALHCRNLAEFLWGKQLTKDFAPRVKARHYARDGEAWELPKPSAVDAIAARASVEVAHLTTGRLSDPDDERKRWVLLDGLELLREGLAEFMARADRGKCSPNVGPAVDALRETLTTPAIRDYLAICVGSTQLQSRVTVYDAP